MSAVNVGNFLTKVPASLNIRESTLGRGHMNVVNVEKSLAQDREHRQDSGKTVV